MTLSRMQWPGRPKAGTIYTGMLKDLWVTNTVNAMEEASPLDGALPQDGVPPQDGNTEGNVQARKRAT